MSLEIEKKGNILTARINRPDARNAVNFDLMARLESLLDELEKDEEVLVFILTGSGKSFISGGDLKEFHQITNAAEAEKMGVRMHKILERIENLPCWTIAGINGTAYGGGWETMLAFDFSVASVNATFGFTQGRFYLPPGWGGLTRLVERTGYSRALWLLAGNRVIDAETAINYGLIHKTLPDESFPDKLHSLSDSLTINDRAFIRHLKENARNINPDRYARIADELNPFGYFWEHEEHINRVNKFLDGKKSGRP